MLPRRAGVLVHPTSLPGPFGVGDMGRDTVRFLDWAAEAGFGVWQVLPLGPPGPEHSPYSSPSAFAGNTELISPQRLLDEGGLTAIDPGPLGPSLRDRIDFRRLLPWKRRLLRRSWHEFRGRASPTDLEAYRAFAGDADQADWLEDWVMFAVLRGRFGGRPWTQWDRQFRDREGDALNEARESLADELDYERYLQFLFCRQWNAVRDAAHQRGINILGDVPIYPAHDSADLWAHRELFQLDADGAPLKVAGVPPDYFSETGQLWGNPLYRWDRMAEDGFAWWVSRLRTNFRRTDRVRLDHFRGFEAYWEVDAAEHSAVGGRWVPGPGEALFVAFRDALGERQFVAEDLGEITQPVRDLRDALGLPGMRVLQFAFGDDPGEHHPDQHPRNAVVYTGTHDNDTSRGWFEAHDQPGKRRILDELQADESTVVWRLIELAYASPADTIIIPLQDLLELGSEARMNVPGVRDGNWCWRVRGDRLTRELAAQLRELADAHGRLG